MCCCSGRNGSFPHSPLPSHITPLPNCYRALSRAWNWPCALCCHVLPVPPELQNPGYGGWSSDPSIYGDSTTEGISLPVTAGGDGGDLLVALHLPPHRGGLCPDCLARDTEQVHQPAGGNLCQEG